MANRINPIPQLRGESVEKLREHVNRVVREVNEALEIRDREIEKLRKELQKDGNK